MLNSRDINLLRPDVAANCLKFLEECKQAGHNVKITGTVRDDEFQMQCYRKGTGGKPPATFHSVKAGLAFDIVKELPGGGIDYNDAKFWREVGQIGKRIGFTWGGDWKRVDKPHFQWDAHGKFAGSNIRAGKYPPEMPLYKEVDDMTAEQTRQIAREEVAAQTTVFHNLADVPLWGKPTVEKLLKRGAINGDGKGIDLPYETLRLLVINDRMGLYGGAV